MRLYETKKYQKIAWLDSQLFPDDDPIVDYEEAVWWLGLKNGEVVAYCGIKPLTEEIAYLNRAGVHPKHQGNRYQLKMIEKRINWAKKSGYKQIITDTVTNNPASVNNLIRAGFKQYLPQYEWKNGITLYWQKEV